MIYLLDANTLIDAKRDYFEFDRVPEFWEWLIYQGESGKIKIPIEIYEEFEEPRKKDGTPDKLATWAANPTVRKALLFTEEIDATLVSYVIANGYCANPSEQEIEMMGRDPFLIAYAMADPKNRTIVTTEVSRPSKKRANRKIPDVSRDLRVRYINNFQLLRELDFKTRWNK